MQHYITFPPAESVKMQYLSLIAFSYHQQNKHMEYKDEFKVIGISTETTNQDSKSMEDMGKLWQKFYQERIPEKIPNKAGDEVYAIYTDYESKHEGKYTSIIGIKVSSLDIVPEGLVGRSFKADGYIKFTAKGEMPGAVANIWQAIWDRDKELNRKYTADFEVYGAKSQRGRNSEVEVYIAVHE